MRVGLDIGYSSVKVAYGTGRTPDTVRLPIGAAPLSHCGMGIDGSMAVGLAHRVFVDGVEWVAGIDPMRLQGFEPSMDENYTDTSEYLALFYAALSEVGETEIESLVTGLPVNHFLDVAHRKRLQNRLLGTHQIRPDLEVTVRQVLVVPQPAGAYGAYSMDVARKLAEYEIDSSTTVVVIDSGHYSLDWVTFHGAINLENSGSTSSAGEEVLRKAAQLLSTQTGVRVPAEKLQDAVLSGAKPLRVGVHEIDFWPAIRSEAKLIVDRNLRRLRSSVRGVSDKRGVDMVLMAGGGAELFRDAVTEAFPGTIIAVVREPMLANCRGYFTYSWQAHPAAARKAV